MATVRANQTVSVVDPSVPGGRVVIYENHPYDSTDPLVREYPWAFSTDVEQATAAPGEKRAAHKK